MLANNQMIFKKKVQDHDQGDEQIHIFKKIKLLKADTSSKFPDDANLEVF